MRNAIAISRYVIQYCKKKHYSISNLKLQKILYFIQAEFLVSLGRPCFREEIHAWDFGPVVPEVYREYKMFGASEIPRLSVIPYLGFTKKEQTLIDDMIDATAIYSANTLVEITHSQEPWIKAYNRGENSVISKQSIRKFFMEDDDANS